MEDLKQKILSTISFREFYTKYIPSFQYYEQMDTYNIECIFHEDTNPSFSLNLKDGLWYCHSCNIGGSIFDFYMKLKNVDFKNALIGICDEFNIDKGKYKNEQKDLNNKLKDIEKWHNLLLEDHEGSLTYLKKERGLSDEIIKEFKLGYTQATQRTTIPIFDSELNLVNIRKHSRFKKDRDKGFKVIGVKDFNSVRLFPITALNEDNIFIFAGEMDCLLAHSLGIKGAITKTGPEKYWSKKFDKYFHDKNIAIIYDNDKAGKEGSKLIANSLVEIARKVKIIELPVNESGEDFTDFIIRYGNNIENFNLLVQKTELYTIDNFREDKIIDSEIHKVSLDESSLAKYYFKKVSFKAIVAGKDLNPFLVPKKIILKCNMSKSKACTFCDMLTKRGKYELEYNEFDPDVLEFVSASQTQKLGIIKKKVNINNCSSFDINIKEACNIEECFLVPSINFKDMVYEDTYRKIYYLGQGLNLNQVYDFEGVTIPDPRDQHSIVMINKASSSDTDIDSFKLTDELKDKLKIFVPEEKTSEGIEKKFQEKYNDLSENVIQIYNRLDLMIAMDLVYHSALKFKFQGIEIEKSHVEALIIGDTRTGKSVTAKRLINHYRLGEIINCEKATIPGLIGGTYDLGSRKILTWGVIPRNDRRLVILDEADGIDTDTISNLSGIRSSCIAERTIAGGTRKALARTRLIWLSNPRGFKSLSEYTTGIEAVKVLIGKPEDIARFDFCLAISQKDVSIDIINKRIEDKVEHKFNSNICNKLILWGWSRKEENIIFTDEAIDEILKYSTAFGKIFSSDIPIVHPNEQRIKLARLSVSLAIATFSTDETFENVIVEKYHVKYIVDFLMEIYSSNILGYTSYSKAKIMETTIENEEEVINKIKNGFITKDELFNKQKYNSKYFIERMLNSHKIQFDDIMDALQTGEREDVRECRQFLLINRCIVKKYSYWIATEPFRELLRKIQREE